MHCTYPATTLCIRVFKYQLRSVRFSYTILFDYRKGIHMRLLLAIFLPFVVFFTIGRPIAGIICLILQVTLIGWLPAAIWAVYALSQFKTDKKIQAALGK